jgi:hypothetical protein
MVFNRPFTTLQVFEKIRQARPSKLYVFSDGSRDGYEGEKERVAKVREIATTVDWPCDVKTLFHEQNLGCKKGCITAINWFFDNEEKGIILEDDCLPHIDFFNFCENLLSLYVDDERVSFISGSNFQNGKWVGDASYYFSKYPHLWGWATWRDRWKKYEVGNMKFWPAFKNSKEFYEKMPDKVEQRFWKNIFNLMFLNKIDTWCYPLNASVWYRGGLTVIPNVNLISNIGFGDNATHTKNNNDKFSKMPVYELKSLVHPKKIDSDSVADQHTFNYQYGGKYLHFPYNWIIFFSKFIMNIFKKNKKIL